MDRNISRADSKDLRRALLIRRFKYGPQYLPSALSSLRENT